MKRYLQHRIVSSRNTFPMVGVYGLAVWLAAGLMGKSLWPQFALFAVTVYVMAELNNSHALIRVYSRMVSCSFVVISCSASFLFPSFLSCASGLLFALALFLLFNSFQDRTAVGSVFYAFVCISLLSIFFIQVVVYVPLLWILMATNLQSMSWRTWFASLLGLLLPYWFMGALIIWVLDADMVAAQLTGILEWPAPFSTYIPSVGELLVYVFVVVAGLLGISHFLHRSYEDKIKIRLLYGCFTTLFVFTALFLFLQPQHFAVLMPMLIISSSALAGHYVSLTSTRGSNIVFLSLAVAVLLITAFNLWSR